MIDGALEIYNQLSSFLRLNEFVDIGEAESLHLECKAPIEPKVTKDIQAHLARALSGFSNTAGGIIIYGVSTTKHTHSGLDVMSQIESIGNILSFEKQVHSRIPTLTTPPVSGYKTKILKRRKLDTKGVVIVYIPKIESDPIQSAKDNQFYYRTGDEFTLAPYEIIKRLFAATESPDINALLFLDRAEQQADGAWMIPIGVQNKSSAIGENVIISVEILNPSACAKITATEFRDISFANPGTKLFIVEFLKVIHRGLNNLAGNLVLKMHGEKSVKKKVQLAIKVYANLMRAKNIQTTIHVTKSGCKLVNEEVNYLY